MRARCRQTNILTNETRSCFGAKRELLFGDLTMKFDKPSPVDSQFTLPFLDVQYPPSPSDVEHPAFIRQSSRVEGMDHEEQ